MKTIRQLGTWGVMLFLLGAISWDQAPVVLGQGQSVSPLSQFAQNIRQLHIVARYFTTAGGTQIQVNLIQTVTGVAIKSTDKDTFWLIEPHHINPEFYYQRQAPRIPPGTPIQFLFFLDSLDVGALVGGGGTFVNVVKRTENYALLKEARARSVPELPIITSLSAGEPVVAALLTQTNLTAPGQFTEQPAKIVEIGEQLFFIDLAIDPRGENDRLHGAPIFVQRDGSWKLAGIFIDHGKSPNPNWSAVARLPELDQLVPKETAKPDRDGDGVPDDDDRCPSIPGDPANNGCPDI
jgi:hypothetical protein